MPQGCHLSEGVLHIDRFIHGTPIYEQQHTFSCLGHTNPVPQDIKILYILCPWIPISNELLIAEHLIYSSLIRSAHMRNTVLVDRYPTAHKHPEKQHILTVSTSSFVSVVVPTSTMFIVPHLPSSVVTRQL